MKRKYLIMIIFLSILVSSIFVFERTRIEKNYRNYDIVADYGDFSSMAMDRQEDLGTYFRELKENGINTVAISEESINSIENEFDSNLTSKVIGSELILEGKPEEIAFIKENLNSTLKEKREVRDISATKIALGMKHTDLLNLRQAASKDFEKITDRTSKGSALEFVGLGFDAKKIKIVKDAGLKVILRPNFDPRYQDGQSAMERFFKTIDQFGLEKSYIIFSGKAVYGAKEDTNETLDKFAEELNKRDMFIGLVEAPNQRGHLDLAGGNALVMRPDVKMARVFSTWDFIQREYDYKIPGHQEGEEIANVYFRAVSERNLASVYVRAFIKDKQVISDPEAYGKVFKSLETRLDRLGFKNADIKPMAEWEVNQKLKAPIAIGIVAAGVLLVSIIFAPGLVVEGTLLILGILLALFFYGLGKKLAFADTFFNLLGIVTFPSLALCFVLSAYNKYRADGIVHRTFESYGKGLGILLCSVLICFIGALMEVSLLSGTNHLMEMVIFRGVKISQILPIIISLFIFGAFVGFDRERVSDSPRFSIKEALSVMDKKIAFWHVCLGVFVMIGLFLFLLRSGNTNVKPSTIELLFRNKMEHIMPVRPRTKAIFIGYPALVSLIYIALKKKSEIFVIFLTLMASIGQANLVNTFSHIRTPFIISLLRISGEYVVGILISIIWILFIELIGMLYNKYIKNEKA